MLRLSDDKFGDNEMIIMIVHLGYFQMCSDHGNGLFIVYSGSLAK